MTDSERDTIITEIHTDMKWLKDWTVEHKALHNKYTYYFIITVMGMLLALVM